MIDRRDVVKLLGPCAAFLGLSSLAMRAGAVVSARKTDLQSWLREIHLLALEMRTGRLVPAEWQVEMTRLAQLIDHEELKNSIDFERVAAKTPFAEKGVSTTKIVLPDPQGVERSIYVKLFAVGAGRAIIPHGHTGMASAHLVLGGRFHLRQYDRIEMNDRNWLVEPIVDRVEQPGAFSTISDDKHNVHWLIAEEDAWTLDFIMAPAVANADWTIQNLDMREARSVAGGLLDVPTLNVEEALAKYG